MNAGVELAASLDYEATLQKVARLVVASFADWCFVSVVDRLGRVEDVAVAHVDPEREALARSLLSNLPQLPSAPHGVSRVLRTLEPESYTSDVDAPPPLGHYLGADYPDALRELGARSYVCVPLVARGTAIGAITYVRGPRAAAYEQRDLEVALELARRSAIALDNARLHRQTAEAVKSRDDLIAILSHDLRSLLDTLQTSAATLRNQDAVGDHETLERLERAAGKMKVLVDNMLDVSSIEAGALSLDSHPHDVEPLVDDVTELLAAAARSKGIALETHVTSGLRVLCDPTRLSQVLTNLIDNAIKLTPRGGCITVRVDVGDGYAQFSVTDTGPGTGPDALPHVFERFWQGRHHARAGAGLGLAIARGIVEAHGGRIWAESEPGHGATFRFSLPMPSVSSEAAAARTAPEDAVESSPGPKIIFVVDDDDAFRRSVKEALFARGYEVREASDGATALEVLGRTAQRRFRPDVVVLDVRMPGCSGLGVLSAMSRLPPMPPTVLVTAFKDPSINVVAERLGAYRVIFKPVDPNDVADAVAAAARDSSVAASSHRRALR